MSDQPTLDMPLCVKFEGHYPSRTTCSECWPYWGAQAEKHAPREQCGDVHAHEPHVWWVGDPQGKWCTGVEQCLEVARLTSELEKKAERYREARAEIVRLRADVNALADELATVTGERDDALLMLVDLTPAQRDRERAVLEAAADVVRVWRLWETGRGRAGEPIPVKTLASAVDVMALGPAADALVEGPAPEPCQGCGGDCDCADWHLVVHEDHEGGYATCSMPDCVRLRAEAVSTDG